MRHLLIGKEKAQQLAPSTDFDEVVRWQEETDEGARVFRRKGHVPLGGIFDIRPHAKRAANWWDVITARVNGNCEHDSCWPCFKSFF